MTAQLDGTRPLLWIGLRRDRILLPACIAGIVLLVLITADSFAGLYPTPGARERFASSIGGNAAFTALYGPARAMDTLGGLVTWRLLTTGATIVGLMAFMVVVRHTRAEEERGQTEMVLAGAVGRRAPVVAGLVLAWGMSLAIGIGSGIVLALSGTPTAGSLAFGAAIASVGVVFAAVGAVAAQLAGTSRAARGIAGVALGAAFVVRAAGDSADGPLTWLSPIGWTSKLQPYANERWWVLVLPLAATVLTTWLAFALLARRDLGGGLLPARGGPSRAAHGLVSPLGLAMRLQRATLLGWAVALFLTGLVMGAVGQNAAELLESSEDIKDLLARGSGALTDQFFASIIVVLGLLAGGAAIQSALRLHGEELAGHAEPLLATALGRIRWAASHLTLAFGSAVLVLVCAGLGLGLADAIASGELEQLWRIGGAVLAQVPAVWVVAAVAGLLVAAVPRAAQGAWLYLVSCLALWLVGPLLDLPQALLDLSPFTHVPNAPAEPVTAAPLIGLTVVALVITAIGLAGLRRRDVQSG